MKQDLKKGGEEQFQLIIHLKLETGSSIKISSCFNLKLQFCYLFQRGFNIQDAAKIQSNLSAPGFRDIVWRFNHFYQIRIEPQRIQIETMKLPVRLETCFPGSNSTKAAHP
jgi:hypothetical protein